MIFNGKQQHVAQETLSIRELLALVQSGVYWWQQEFQSTEGVDRERAAGAIKDLSRILDSLSQQLAQGRETIRITTRLPVMRAYPVGCPVCGHGNRTEARYCFVCGSLLSPLSLHKAEPGVVPLPIWHLDAAAQSDKGRVRQNNEDTCVVRTLPLSSGGTATLLLVADGMGGAQAGEEASRVACDVLQSELTTALQVTQPTDDEAWQMLLHKAVFSANERVYAQAKTDRAKNGMGTTLTVLVITGDRSHMAHVGDSRAYLINMQGATEDGALLAQLSTDHTLVARLIAVGQLTPEQARQHAQRNILYRVLGTDPVVEIDTSSHTLSVGDTLLLCSDGLTCHVEDVELARIALDIAQPASVCKQLVALANDRGGQDNISVIVAKVRRASA